MSKKIRDWIVLNYSVQPNRLECLRCGESHELQFPVSFNMLEAQMKAFGKDHKHCKEKSHATTSKPSR